MKRREKPIKPIYQMKLIHPIMRMMTSPRMPAQAKKGKAPRTKGC